MSIPDDQVTETTPVDVFDADQRILLNRSTCSRAADTLTVIKNAGLGQVDVNTRSSLIELDRVVAVSPINVVITATAVEVVVAFVTVQEVGVS